MSQHQPTAPAVPTALVVDDSPAARHRISTLLTLGGWRVHEAAGTDAALSIAAAVDLDLVVTDMVMRNGHGATLVRRLRENGSRARVVVTAARRTQQVRALAASAGAVACLAKPVDPRLFVDILRGLTADVLTELRTAPAAEEPVASERAKEMYASALPHRLASIVLAARGGDAAGVASAAELLAAASARLGHTEVASVSTILGADARRGVVPQGRLMELVRVCSRAEGRRWAPAGATA